MQSHEVAKIETLDFSHQKRINEVHRFCILIIGTLCSICVSFTYAFNLVSGTMQKQYDLSQRDLCTISTLGLVFLYFSMPYGFLFDYIGPIPIAALATVCYPVGTICLALTFMGVIKGSVVKLAVFNALMGAGCIQFDLISIMPTISYFPTRKGYVTGLLKTFTGLGQALVGTIYIGFFNQKPDRHFFFLAAFAIVVGVLSILFMRLPPYHLTGYQMTHLSVEEKQKLEHTKAQYLAQKPPMWRFLWGFSMIIFFTVYLPVQSVITAFAKVNHNVQIGFAIIAVVAFGVFCMLCFPWTACCHKKQENSDSEVMEEQDEEGVEVATPTLERMVNLDNVDEKVVAIEDNPKGKNEVEMGGVNSDGSHTSDVVTTKKPVLTDLDYIAPQYQGTFLHNLLTPELWAIFWSLFVIVGAELVVIFNASYILGALMGRDLKSEERTLLTVFNGIGSAIGRIIMSIFEVCSQNRKAEDRIPITVALFLPTCSVIIALILFLALPGNLSLLLPIILIALGNGFVNATIVLTTRTIYVKDTAKHYNFCSLAMCCSAIIFVRALYGEWYSREAQKAGSNLVCYGRQCVQVPLIILVCLSATAFLSNVFLHLRYSAFNKRTLRARAEMREEAERNEEVVGRPEMTDDLAVYAAEPNEEDLIRDKQSECSAK